MDNDTRLQRAVTVSRVLNIVALAALLLVLSGSLLLQFGFGEPPCPLCLVQRSGMIGLAVGPMMNLLWGIRPRHYAISILAALVGGAGSIRQILLHIATPGDQGYGPAVLGFHLYTWADITFVVAVAGIAILLMWSAPFEAEDRGVLGRRGAMRTWSLVFIAWVTIYLVIIGISVLPECGLGMCPDDPANTGGLGGLGGLLMLAAVAVVSVVIGIVLNRRLPERD